jgi:hypothetical protein
LPPLTRDQFSSAGVDDDRGDQEPGDDPSDNAVADLLEQERPGAAAARDVRFHVGHRHGGEQQRDADPVVQAALDVQSLADSWRDARLGDDCLPECSVGGRQHDRQDDGLCDGDLPEDHSRRNGAERDRQRQADTEQPQRHTDLAAKLSEIDARGVAEQDQRQRRLRQRLDGRARARQIDPVEHLGSDQQPDGDEQHRRRDRSPR